MAASLFRLGRFGALKGLRQDVWGRARTPLAAALCTKTDAPKKPAKKASTLEAPGEGAALLGHKTTVAFPTRLPTPGSLGQGAALGALAQNETPVRQSAAPEAKPTAEPAPSTSQVSRDAPSQESSANNNAREADDDDGGGGGGGGAAKVTPTKKDVTSSASADVRAQKKDDVESSSSSSSSSSSDSDSDSDDEKPDKTGMTEPVFQPEDKAGQKKTPSAVREEPPAQPSAPGRFPEGFLREEPPSDTKTGGVPEHAQPSAPGRFPEGFLREEPPSDTKTGGVPEHAQPSAPGRFPEASPKQTTKPSPVGAPADTSGSPVGANEVTSEVCQVSSEPPSEKAPASGEAATSSEEPGYPAPENVKLQAKQAGPELKSSEVSHSILKLVPEGAPEAAAESKPTVDLDPATEVTPEPIVGTVAAAETTQADGAAGQLVDTAPVIAEAEEVRAEPEAAAAPEEVPAAPAPEPEAEPEPFDNTKYKNTQHHNYNIYTFVDMDVEMSQHRLPQPSTGRPSPRD